MTMPSELTRGMPRPPRTPATIRITRKNSRKGREEVFVVLRAMQGPLLTKLTGSDDVKIAQNSCGTNPSGCVCLPKPNAANFVFAPLANVEMPVGIQCEPDRRIHDRLDAEQTVAVLKRTGGFLRHKPRGTAATHVLVFIAAVAVACHRGDDAGYRINLAHAMIHRIGNIQIILLVEHHGFRSMEHRTNRRLLVAVITVPAHSGQSRDDTAVLIDLSHPITALIDKDDVAFAVHRNPDDVVEARL